MAKGNVPKDIFMQFAALRVALDGVATQTLKEAKLNTGLSIRGGLIWLIHRIEFIADGILTAAGVSGRLWEALSTLPNQALLPELDDKGCLAQMVRIAEAAAASDGIGSSIMPKVFHFLPPIPLAAPSLSFYAKTGLHIASMVDEVQTCRIGFTTAPLDQGLYAEIAEVWGY